MTYSGTQNHLQVTVSNPSDPHDGSCFAPLGDATLTSPFWHDLFWKFYFIRPGGIDYSPSNPHSANSLLGLTTPQLTPSDIYTPLFARSYTSAPWTSGP